MSLIRKGKSERLEEGHKQWIINEVKNKITKLQVLKKLEEKNYPEELIKDCLEYYDTQSVALDKDIQKKINKHPRFMRKQLRKLYKDYKAGKMIFPEGYDQDKFLDKE
jgi:hypothetical protein